MSYSLWEAIMTQNNVKTWVKHYQPSLRESFEECAIQLHHFTPQDEIDKGMFCLFADESDPKELFAVLHNLDEECLEKSNLD
ncbi:hypothetical protein Glove_50g68 [Diversispora epigaea]|uniref:Uncharacterized protein n=1 Tax=Diversispora epigaea TaxID=1348612 RepID=A0A397JNP9_9GLOM|nr:hypothetical protein Glove_50g68 [Diversispora epigaea]